MKKMKDRKFVFNLTIGVFLAFTVILSSCSKDSKGPSINAIFPPSVATGDEITIEGTNLSNSTILVAGVSVPAISNTSTSIVTQVPAYASIGVQEVKVTNSKGSATGSVTVASMGAGPVITSISPSSASLGQQITINGTGFGGGVGVEIATKIATVEAYTATTITVTIPTTGIALGAASVRVTTSLGTVVTSMTII